MSRCFPYPPPGYDVSPIESFKLQKEIELVKEKEKKRHRKEKREKKHKKTDDAEYKHKKTDDSEHKHNKRKREEKNLLEQKIDNCTEKICAKAELLERSGLTEEHELPCNVRNSESSESSHDSKRKKIVSSNVSLTSNGTKLRIKFSVPKQEDHGQQSLARMEKKVSEPSTVVVKPSSSVISEPKYSEQRRNLLISRSSARVQQKGSEMSSINLEAQPLVRLENKNFAPSRVVVKAHEQQSLGTMENKVSGLSKVVLKPSSTQPKYSEARRNLCISQSSARVQQKGSEVSSINLEAQTLVRRLENKNLAPSRVVAKAHEKQSLGKTENKVSRSSKVILLPPSSVRTETKYSEARRNLSISQSSEMSSINLEAQPLVRLENNYLAPSRVVVKPKEVVLPSTIGEPCFSGRETCLGQEADKTAKCSKSRSSRNGTKGTGQSTNFTLNYNFPPLEFESMDTGDDQWLFGAPKQSAHPAANSKVSVDGLSTAIVSSETSIQPRACYMPEFEMYQLPYVIPF